MRIIKTKSFKRNFLPLGKIELKADSYWLSATN